MTMKQVSIYQSTLLATQSYINVDKDTWDMMAVRWQIYMLTNLCMYEQYIVRSRVGIPNYFTCISSSLWTHMLIGYYYIQYTRLSHSTDHFWIMHVRLYWWGYSCIANGWTSDDITEEQRNQRVETATPNSHRHPHTLYGLVLIARLHLQIYPLYTRCHAL